MEKKGHADGRKQGRKGGRVPMSGKAITRLERFQ